MNRKSGGKSHLLGILCIGPLQTGLARLSADCWGYSLVKEHRSARTHRASLYGLSICSGRRESRGISDIGYRISDSGKGTIVDGQGERTGGRKQGRGDTGTRRRGEELRFTIHCGPSRMQNGETRMTNEILRGNARTGTWGYRSTFETGARLESGRHQE